MFSYVDENIDIFLQVSHWTIHYGGADVGDVVRKCMGSVITDKLVRHYNRTGRIGKDKLPAVMEHCLLSK